MASIRSAVRLASLVDGQSPAEVFGEVRRTLAGILPGSDLDGLYRVFRDVRRLFEGRYPGYRGCNTRYHDFEHTTDTLLAMARLVRGAAAEGRSIDARTAHVGLAAALLHDTGYIQRTGDRAGTGAKYTASHIRRSIDFAREYLPTRGYSADDYGICRNALLCTGLDVHLERVRFRSPDEALVGRMLGAADLIGQMASCRYLENLHHLYDEFREGRVPVPPSERDFLANTPRFYRMVLHRFAVQLGDVQRYAKAHFRKDLGVDRNLYMDAIEANIGRLEGMLARRGRAARHGTSAVDARKRVSIRPVNA